MNPINIIWFFMGMLIGVGIGALIYIWVMYKMGFLFQTTANNGGAKK